MTAPDEEWRPLPSNPDYLVSNRGGLVPVKGGRIRYGWRKHSGYYGHSVAGRETTRHALVCETFHGPKPTPAHEVRHLNGIPGDDRPDNLAWGTRSENVLDRVRHGVHHLANKTHCKRGHEFTPENTDLRDGGRRRCITCRRLANHEYDRRKRAQNPKPPRPPLEECPHGHSYLEPGNAQRGHDGRLRCRTCMSHRRHARYLRTGK